MPLYPYTCDDCGHAFEKVVSASGEASVACPSCGSGEVVRGFGLPAVGTARPPAGMTNCRGDGPPCGAAGCGRLRAAGGRSA